MDAHDSAIADVVLNPGGAGHFGVRHVILNGRTDKPLRVEAFSGPFSIKSVIRGQAVWHTRQGRHALRPGSHLVMNRGTCYSLSIDARSPVETFCIFFQDGFVEQALRVLTTSDAALLDHPDDRAESFELLECVQDNAQRPAPKLDVVRRVVQEGGVGSVSLSGALHVAAMAVVSRAVTLARMSRDVPAIRASTRRELVRRLQGARVFMRSQIGSSISLSEIAREACLSPFHFHRNFRALFGETPHHYLMRLRLNRAADRLIRTTLPVTDIALSVGFESPAHFSRAFKRRYRLSPARYRRRFGR